MSSTIICGSRAAAFRDPDGSVVYALFEQSYESNVSPRTPRWSCHHLGRIESTLTRIFDISADCEGGMVKSWGKCITAEGFIAGQLKHLANPCEMPDRPVRLEVTSSYRSPVAPADVKAVCAILRDNGNGAGAKDLAEGRAVELSLHRDALAIVAILEPRHRQAGASST
ncbi:MAG: hypothetical protein K2P80_05155 [Beijerinckiaceae bacterium]|nr:hypothetical protein [Beijerinckiaceae bacterium]